MVAASRQPAVYIVVLFGALLLTPLGPSTGSLDLYAGGAPSTALTGSISPTPGPWRTASHVDTPTSDLYVAETLTSARWSTGAIKEQFLGRPFWIEPVTGRGVRVAVIDTGVDPDHPDLEGSVVAFRDFLYGRGTAYDDDTHGTHVAGIIAAHGHAQLRPDRHYFPFGARGVAPDVDLIIAKAMDTNGDGDAHHVAQAILWALDPDGDGDYADGAHVINLSIGLETTPPRDDQGDLPTPVTVPVFGGDRTPEAQAVRSAIQTAVRAGAVVVVAAGNHEPGAADSTVTFPGSMPEVITVGAVDGDGRVASFSNEGAPGSGKPDLVAPGVLLSTFPAARDLEDSQRDGYVALGGTSMAAPMVAGTVALMLEAQPELRGLSKTEDLSWHTREVRNALIGATDQTDWDPKRGWGTLRVDGAVAEVDTGEGPVNWDGLGLLTLLVVVLVGAVVLRRRGQRRRAAVRRAKAEARARLAETSGTAPAEDGPDADATGTGAGAEPTTAGPRATGEAETPLPWDDPAGAAPGTGDERVPEWQRPPFRTGDDR